MSVAYIIIGLMLLVFGGEFLVRSSIGLSFKLNISKMVIGMTVVSFATSIPELLVSLQAALDGSPAIAINNVIGSNIANIALVLGVTAIISPIMVSKDFYKLNWPVMMLFSLLLFYFLWNDNLLTRAEGVVLLAALFVFLFVLIRSARKNGNTDAVDDELATVGYGKLAFWFLIGGAALYYGSDLLVEGAKELAVQVGVSEGVISITMIAIGTSIPELAASVVAVVKGEKALSLGNLIGSNIFNIASVLGVTAIVKEISVTEPQILTRDIYWMLGVAFAILPLVFIPKKYVLSRYKGMFLFFGYGLFIYRMFL